jgi:hypothetical protein
MLARSEVDERIFLKPLLTDSNIIFSDKFDGKFFILKIREDFKFLDETVFVLFGESHQYIDTDFLVKFTSQNCLAKLSAPTKFQPPTEGKSYMITPDVIFKLFFYYN